MKDSSYAFATGYVWKSPKEEAGNELRVRTSFNQRSFFLLLIDISFDGCVQFVLSLSLSHLFFLRRGDSSSAGGFKLLLLLLFKKRKREIEVCLSSVCLINYGHLETRFGAQSARKATANCLL